MTPRDQCPHGYPLDRDCLLCDMDGVTDARRREDMSVPFTDEELADVRLWVDDQTRGPGRRTAKPVSPRRNAVLIARLLANIDAERAKQRAELLGPDVVVERCPAVAPDGRPCTGYAGHPPKVQGNRAAELIDGHTYAFPGDPWRRAPRAIEP